MSNFENSLILLKNLLKISTRKLPNEFGLKFRKFVLAHYRFSNPVPHILLSKIYSTFQNHDLSSQNEEIKFYKNFIENEYEHLIKICTISMETKGKSSFQIKNMENLVELNFVGILWKRELEKIAKIINFEIPTFSDYEKYAKNIDKIQAQTTSKLPNCISIFDDNLIIKCSEIYKNYKYLTQNIS